MNSGSLPFHEQFPKEAANAAPPSKVQGESSAVSKVLLAEAAMLDADLGGEEGDVEAKIGDIPQCMACPMKWLCQLFTGIRSSHAFQEGVRVKCLTIYMYGLGETLW